MSHFTKLVTEIKNLDLLKKALDVLGMDYVDEKSICRGYSDQVEVDFLIKSPVEGYDIGLIKKDNQWEMVADWFGMISAGGERLGKKILKEYARQSILEYAGINDYTVTEKVEEDGSINLILRKFQ